jgi:hypothetical protein
MGEVVVGLASLTSYRYRFTHPTIQLLTHATLQSH